MAEIRDISGSIYSGMWQYCPEYPGARITELPHPAFLPDDYPVFLQGFELGGQSGTYIETRAHVDKSSEPVTALPLTEFYRPVVVIDLGVKESNQAINVADLEDASPEILPGDAVLLSTGWDRKWYDPDFVENSPYIGKDAAMWLIEKGIGLLGSDFPRFDYPKAMQFPWAEYWERVNLTLAPVVNLTGLSGRCGTLICFPLNIKGAVSTPCRAAIILGE
jgi:kynurenine formamidase